MVNDDVLSDKKKHFTVFKHTNENVNDVESTFKNDKNIQVVNQPLDLSNKSTPFDKIIDIVKKPNTKIYQVTTENSDDFIDKKAVDDEILVRYTQSDVFSKNGDQNDKETYFKSNIVQYLSQNNAKSSTEIQNSGQTNEGFIPDDISQKFDPNQNENSVKNTISKIYSDKPIFWTQLFGALVSATVHMAVGCVVGYTGVTLPSLMDRNSTDIVLDKFQASIFSSIVNIGALAGSLLSSVMMTWLGQRTTLLAYMPIGMMFWTTLAFANSFWLLVLSRIVQGVVIGVSAGCANNYVVETVHKSVRGRLFALIDLARQVGFLFMYVVGSTSLSWRYVGLICGLISMALPFTGMIFLPHSPRWLALQGRHGEVRKSLVFYRGLNYDVDEEMRDIQKQLEMSSKNATVWNQLKMLTKRSIAFRFFILAVLLCASHFTGNFAYIAYSVSIFQSAEVDINPYFCTIIVACARIIGVAIYMLIADKYGRRLLLMIPLFLSGLCMFMMGFFFFVRTLGGDTSTISYIPLASSIIYIIFTMMSHPVLMLLRSELLPTAVRSVGVGLLYWFFFCGSFGVSISYPYMVDVIGSHWTFWIYGFTSLAMVAIIAVSIPETKGRSLEEIDELFEKKKTNGL